MRNTLKRSLEDATTGDIFAHMHAYLCTHIQTYMHMHTPKTTDTLLHLIHICAEYERGRLEIEKLRWSMSVECVAELRTFYDSQEVIEEEERLRKQNLEEATESTRQQKHKFSELSSDTIPDEIEEAIMEEDSVGMKLTQTSYDTHQMHFRTYLVLLYTHVSSLRSLFI